MPFGWVAGAIAVGSAIKTNQKNKNARDANNAQQQGIADAKEEVTEAAKKAQGYIDPITKQGDTSRGRLDGATSSYYEAGKQGLDQLAGQRGALNVNEFLDPSAEYSMKQANNQLEASAAARGGLLSGATLKALNEQSSHLAQQNYNNAAQLALNSRGQQITLGNSLVDAGNIGVGIDTNLNGQGTQGRFNQAQVETNLGDNLANASISSGNSNAAMRSSQGSVLGNAISDGASAYGKYKFSDERHKHNVEHISDAEIDEFLSKMEPKSYEYDEDVVAKGAEPGKNIGVMAQDAEKSKVGKTLIEHDEDGVKMMNTPKTVAALLATTISLNNRLKKVEGKK